MEVAVGLFHKTHRKHAISRPHRNFLARLCRFEQMESRQLLSVTAAPIHLGAVYFEDSSPNDHVGDVFEITFNGGAAGTQLTELRINTDKLNDGLGMGDTFFDTAPGGLGAFGSSPFAVVSQTGIDSVTAEVVDGGTQLVLKFKGFDAGEKFVFSIDVDEQGFLQPNAVAEGAEFEGSLLSADFTASHYQQATGSDMFVDAYDGKLAGLGLDLPGDNYDPPSPYMPPGSEPGPVYTAGAAFPLQQTPLPITLSGTVFEDLNADNHQQTGDPGIGGVHLALYELVDGSYVATGKTAVTDAAGNYKFDGLLPSTYRVVETQPGGYLSVGAAAGTVGGTTRGVVTSVDVLSSINLDGGDDSIRNDFAETKPAQLSGHVYHDANNNGVMDAGEEGIGGVHLVVEGASGSINAYTADDGSWSVTDLLPGQYKVTEYQPEDYIDGLDAPGSAGGAAHNPGDLIDGIYLSSGQSGINYDFGEIKPGCISGYVYVDANNNGVFDEGETPLSNVELTLLDASGKPTGETRLTDDTGYYRFCGLVPGVYAVSEGQPDGYYDGIDSAGTSGGTAHNPGDLIDVIPLASGVRSQNNNFGELAPASIGGQVFADLNDDGVLNSGDRSLAGVTIYLLDSAGKRITSTTTDANGKYAFTNLKPGVYGVEEIQPANYLQGSDRVGSAGGALNGTDRILNAALSSGVNGVNYDFWEVLPASISGFVYVDKNDNGIFDPSETPLAGVTVTLLDAAGNPTGQTRTTDAKGFYEFQMLSPGEYSVRETQPLPPKYPYFDGIDTAGTVDGMLVGTAYNDLIDKIHVGPGQSGINYNFGELPPATISGYVFQDGPTIVVKTGELAPDIPSVRDGKRTADDTPLSGVELLLCDGSGYPVLDEYGNPRTATTDATGHYHFDMLRPNDEYSIIEIEPSGYQSGLDSLGFVAGKASGYVYNKYDVPDASILSTLAVDPSGPAIIKIYVGPNDQGTEYNFSHVLMKSEPPHVPPIVPPVPPLQPMGPLVGTFAQYPPWGHAYYSPPEILLPLMAGGSGGPAGFSWHLSIIDAGQPRHDGSGDQFVQYPQDSLFDPVSWTGADLAQSQWILADQNGVATQTIRFGMPGATPVAGDWNGSGTTKIGVFIDGLWFLDLNGNGTWDAADLWAKLGKKADQPVSGDWNGDGKTDIGIFGPAWIGDLKAVAVEPGLPDAQNLPIKARPKNVPPDPADAAVGWRTMKKTHSGKLRSDLIDHVFEYGTKGDHAMTGDWNGDGIYTVAIFRNGVWFLDMDGDGRWSDGDVMVEFGQEGDLPVVGDWTGDGISKLGVYRNGTFYLDTNNNRQLDATDKVFQLGNPGDKPIAGDWTGDGIDKVGVYQQAASNQTQTASADTGSAAAVK